MWLRTVSGVAFIYWYTEGGYAMNLNVDTTWRRFVLPANEMAPTASGQNLYFVFGIYYNTIGARQIVDVLFGGAQWEDVSGQSNQTPGEYVSTNVLSAPFHGSWCDGVKCFPYKNAKHT